MIFGFVQSVTNATGQEFVPVASRIAVFDNDGTLWCEQPMYVEVVFSFARVEKLVAAHPELRNREPYRMVVDRDTQALVARGDKGIGEVVAATHSGMTAIQFDSIAGSWLASAWHPRFNRHYTDLAYQPMLELLAYLRANGFRTFVVSGGGADFMRVYAPGLYGLQPDQVIGTTGKLAFELRDGKAELRKLPDVDPLDDGPGKPVGIHQYIGQQPILAFGNSDGDLQMLQYADEGGKTGSGPHPRLMLLLHHDDAVREYAYDRNSKVGHLDKALDAARQRGWIVVSMKVDWKTVFKSP
jgi:phosphoserine phosphatase